MAQRPTQPLSGYSTQARISLQIADLVNNGRIHFWFATSINPPGNDLASNPLEIFAQLERASCKGRLECDAEKVESLLFSLATWVYEAQRSGAAKANQAALLIREAYAGSLGLLEPEMFVLKDVIPHRLIGGDEFVLENEPYADHERNDSYGLGDSSSR